MNIDFTEGDRPSLLAVLDAREERSLLQDELCRKHPTQSLIAYKLNIPGPVKNNATIQRIFEIGKEDLFDLIMEEGWKVSSLEERNAPTGPELFLLVKADPLSVKAKTVSLEEETPLGRVFDMDVLHWQESAEENQPGRAVSLKRSAVNQPERRCFVCAAPAKECGRSRKHSVEELLEKITEMIQEERRF